MLGSGFEERNAVWANSRRRYDVGYGVKSLADLHDVIAFFEARRGRLHAFRFRDFADCKSCAPTAAPTPRDQALGTGDGESTEFQLVKIYGAGTNPWTRTINKPVAGSVRVAVDDEEQAEGWSVDPTTGLITFDTPPASGAALTAGFEFDTPGPLRHRPVPHQPRQLQRRRNPLDLAGGSFAVNLTPKQKSSWPGLSRPSMNSVPHGCSWMAATRAAMTEEG